MLAMDEKRSEDLIKSTVITKRMATRLFWNFMGISGTEIQNVIQQTRIILCVVSQKGELYQEIMDKQRYLQSHGYTYICEWGKLI